MMYQAKVVALVALCALLCQPAISVETTLTFDEAAAKNRPVAKVVALLKDMIKQMEKEGEEDEGIFEKMGCWCVTNEKSKTQSIADAQTQVDILSSSVESLS